MKLLVTGASGLLGQKIVKLALEKGNDVYSLYNKHTINLGIPIQLDLINHEELYRTISHIKPDAIIHTAAYTDVDGIEVNRDLAWKINAEATKYIATASAKTDSLLVYLSTDYVFDGEIGYYAEEDHPNPISYYGYTKLEGEKFIKKHSKDWCIARTSVIYGWGTKHKQNFSTWLLTNVKQGKEVNILTDQYVSPTLNTNLAEMLIEIAEKKITGTLHTAGATRSSRYDFALKLAETFQLNTNMIKRAKMNEMSWNAKRPKDSSLNVSRVCVKLNAKPLTLDQALTVMLGEGI